MLYALTAGRRYIELTYLDVNQKIKDKNEMSFELTEHKKPKRKAALPINIW